MKKLFLLIICFIFLAPCSDSKIITGEVEYNVNSAREEAFSEKPLTPNKYVLQSNITDRNNLENKTTLLKGITEIKDRTLAYFSDGSYGVMYKDNPTSVFYYNSNGILTHNEIKDSLTYPYKTYKYNTYGKLVNITLRISEDETFIFKPSGEMIAHWKKENCYDENNNIIMTRKILK